MSLRDLSLVAFGGAVGSVARYLMSAAVMRATSAGLLGGAFPSTAFPWGTWLVNALGCIGIGMLAGAGVRHGENFPNEIRLLCVTGFLGGFTTFSAFSLETWMLISRHDFAAAAFNVGTQCLVGITGVAFGFWAVTRLFS